jgi:hypothetical protein
VRHDGKVLRCYTEKWFRQPILKPQAREDGARGCKQSIPHLPGLQLPHNIHPKISSKGFLQCGQKGNREHPEGALSVQGLELVKGKY